MKHLVIAVDMAHDWEKSLPRYFDRNKLFELDEPTEIHFVDTLTYKEVHRMNTGYRVASKNEEHEEEMLDIEERDTLTKVLQKAVDGGLTGYWADRYKRCKELDEMEYLVAGNIYEEGHSLEELLFNHDFAKALWGVQRCESACCGSAVTQRTMVNGKPIKAPWLSLLNEKGTKILSKYAVTHFHYCDNCKKKARLISYVGYELHLQQMVISPDPIKYLGENI